MRRMRLRQRTWRALACTRSAMSQRRVGSRSLVFATVKSRAFVLLAMIGGLAVAGTFLGRVADPVWTTARARQPGLRLDASMTAAGQGVTLALLGGFRTLVADATWIRMYV